MSSLTRCQLQYVIHITYFLISKHDLSPPICFSCQRFYKVHLVYSLLNTSETHNNTANYLLSVMVANCIISLTCSECLKCKGSHLLVRCPRQTASTERKGCLSHPFKELLCNKIKESYILLFGFPPSGVSVRCGKHN